MANEFVSREEFDNLKQEVQGIKEDMSKNGELLVNIDKKTSIIFEKIENISTISNMQIEPLKKDIEKNTENIKELKSNSQWTWKAIGTTVIGIAVKVIFDMYKG